MGEIYKNIRTGDREIYGGGAKPSKHSKLVKIIKDKKKKKDSETPNKTTKKP